jgi:hypothetical protein
MTWMARRRGARRGRRRGHGRRHRSHRGGGAGRRGRALQLGRGGAAAESTANTSPVHCTPPSEAAAPSSLTCDAGAAAAAPAGALAVSATPDPRECSATPDPRTGRLAREHHVAVSGRRALQLDLRRGGSCRGACGRAGALAVSATQQRHRPHVGTHPPPRPSRGSQGAFGARQTTATPRRRPEPWPGAAAAARRARPGRGQDREAGRRRDGLAGAAPRPAPPRAAPRPAPCRLVPHGGPETRRASQKCALREPRACAFPG